MARRIGFALQMLGRLQQGVSPEQAQARLKPPFENALANASPVDPNETEARACALGSSRCENLRDDYEAPRCGS